MSKRSVQALKVVIRKYEVLVEVLDSLDGVLQRKTSWNVLTDTLLSRAFSFSGEFVVC